MPMAAITNPGGDDAQIRECVEAIARALRARDVDALMGHYAPDVVTFDLRPPLQIRGVDAYRKNFEAWFAAVHGPIEYEIRDLRVTVGDGVAFCCSACHITSTLTTGGKSDYWVRVTSGFLKMQGQWMITHEHISMPIDMGTMRAAPAGG